MGKEKSLQELEIERQKAKRELKIAEQNVKILESEERRLTRNQRTHRLVNGKYFS